MEPSATTAALLARRDAVFGAGSTIFYEQPVHLVRGEGVWLFDPDGRRYLDLYNNIPVVGHCNPRVVEALCAQAATHTTHTRYLDDRIVEYGERLLSLHHDDIEHVVFTCSGTEANEVAMRMARMVTGGTGFICTDATYHGNSELVAGLTRAPHRGRPGVHAIPFPQRYRPIVEGATDEQLCEAHLAELQRAIDDFAAEGTALAGVIFCSILANEGLPDVPADFLPRAAAMVRAAGGLVIMDEVQAGFCRSGHWWGYEKMGVVPDIVTMGKPMGNGMPLAACAARADLMDTFRSRTRYFNTFAGSPLQAAAGMAVLDEITDRGLLAQVNDVGGRLLAMLADACADVPQAGDVRGCGLFIGIEWVTDRESKQPDAAGAVRMVNLLRDRGMLLSNAGAFSNVLKVRPPLVFDHEHAELFVAEFRAALGDLHG
ncbi:MAG: aspartate aminotransferase family protein [Ilumatobacteraceae bacterium]